MYLKVFDKKMHSFRTDRKEGEENETGPSEKKENGQREGSKETEGKEVKSSQSSHHATSNPNTQENRYREVRRT